MSLATAPVRGWVRPEVSALSAYHLEQEPCRFKLDQNEVPWDLPRSVKRAIADRLVEENWARYPDFHGDDLRRALARRHGHPAAGVLVGNGSNELLGITLEALAGPGDEVISLLPGFGLYPMLSERAGGRARRLGPREDLSLPLDELLSEVERDPGRPVILCSPNNPTGEAVHPDWVAGLLERLRAPLLLDNAYGEFCRHDYRPLLARHPNLVLFRTFSKAWSLAGLRLGYLLAHPDLVRELIKIKLPYNLGKAAAVAGEEVLRAAPRLERRVHLIRQRRGDWSRMLAARGFEVFDSEANFLLVRCPGWRAREVRAGLAEQGILVRDVSHYPGMAGCLRIAVGSGPALRATARALDAMSDGGSPPKFEHRGELI